MILGGAAVVLMDPQRRRLFSNSRKGEEMDKKSVLISQLLMTFMMALSMSGIMSVIELGPTATWLAFWPGEFAIAWPTAFVLTMIMWPLALSLTRLVAGPALGADTSSD